MMMTFAQPIWLYTLPVALLAWAGLQWLVLLAVRRRLKLFAAAKLLERLAASFSLRRFIVKAILGGLALIMIMVSLARPQQGFTTVEQQARGVDVLFALDTSRSMLAEDIRPNRLERSKLAIQDILREMQGNRVGLIAFAGSAFLQCPLTLDYEAFQHSLRALNTDIIPIQGTNIAAAIETTRSVMRSQANFKILILITDGEDLEASGIQMARTAAAEGMRIFTVGVGNPGGDLIPLIQPDGSRDYVRDGEGRPVRTILDESTLIAIAREANGVYAPLGASGQGLATVYREALEGIPAEELGTQFHQTPIERYQWPLAFAILLLWLEPLVSMRRRLARATLPILAMLLALPTPTDASAGEAAKAYAQGRYEQAVEMYQSLIEAGEQDSRIHYNLGNSLYRLNRYQEAIEQWLIALPAAHPNIQKLIFHNLGNASFRQALQTWQADPAAAYRMMQEAQRHYRNALDLDPQDSAPRQNLERLVRTMESLQINIQLASLPFNGGHLTGSGGYLKDEKINIQAHPAKGYRFDQWEAETEGVTIEDSTKAKTTISSPSSARITARFVETYNLQLTAEPAGGGTVEKSGDFDANSEVPIKAVAKDYWAFSRWHSVDLPIADTGQAESTLTLTHDGSAVAHFVEAWKLDVSVSPAEGGKAGPSGFFPRNQTVPIEATPRPGFEWIGWTGDGVQDPGSQQTQIFLNRDHSATALMQRVWNLLTLPSKDEAGQVEGGGNYPPGTVVPISATPNEGFTFLRWEGEGVEDPQAAQTNVTVVEGDHNVIAVFDSENEDSSDQQDQNQDQEDQQDQQDQSESEQNEESEQSENDQQDQNEQQEEPESQTPEEQNDETSAEQEQQPNERQEGQMTQEEAIQLLQQAQQHDRLLPVGEPSQSKPDNRKGRDW